MMCAEKRTLLAFVACLGVFAAITLTGCSAKDKDKGKEPASAVTTPQADAPAVSGATSDEPLPPLAQESALPVSVRAELNETFKGDLDEMVKRRLVRVGVTSNRTLYFVDRGVQRGVAY